MNLGRSKGGSSEGFGIALGICFRLSRANRLRSIFSNFNSNFRFVLWPSMICKCELSVTLYHGISVTVRTLVSGIGRSVSTRAFEFFKDTCIFSLFTLQCSICDNFRNSCFFSFVCFVFLLSKKVN